MRSAWARSCVAAAIGAAALACPVVGAAQQQAAIPLSRFRPAPAGDRFYGVPSPYVGEHLVPHLMVLADYAHDPLVLLIETPDGDESVGSVVRHLGQLHVNGNLGLYQRVAIDVDVPIALVQKGMFPASRNVGYVSPDSPAFGDVRLGMRLRLFGEQGGAFQIGMGGYLWLPTGDSDPGSMVSDGSVRGMPQLLLGGLYERFVWSFAAGPEIRKEQTFGATPQGSFWSLGGGVGMLLGADHEFQVGVESTFSVDLGEVTTENTNAEALLSGKWRPVDFLQTGVGIGTGLARGIGTPDLRAVLSLAFTPAVSQLRDRDGDGIDDEVDACPQSAGGPSDEPAAHGCPDRDGDGVADEVDACPGQPGVPAEEPTAHGCPADRDGDRIVDDVDACPDLAGSASDAPDRHGCPADADSDGIVDGEDACPELHGPASTDPSRHGCPPDGDGDGIVDASDGCPGTPGQPHEDPSRNGCPIDRDGDGILDGDDACPERQGRRNDDPAKNGCPLVMVTAADVVIGEKIQFELNEAAPLPASDPLLDEIARVLREHDELLEVEIQGHTDTTGAEWRNQPLSQQRAEAVKAALEARGVQAARLTAKGYGSTVPLADNDTEQGRQQNRRVEFKIVRRAEQ